MNAKKLLALFMSLVLLLGALFLIRAIERKKAA